MNDPLGLFDDEDKGSDPLGLFADEEPSRLDKLKGAGEAALNITTGLVGQIPAGIGTILDTVNELTQGRHDPKKAEKRFEDLSRFFTYEPRTEKGKEYVENIMTPDVVNTLNALGGIAHTMPPARTGPTVRSLVPKDTPIPQSRLDKLNQITKQQEQPKVESPAVLPDANQLELDLFSPDQKQIGQSPYDAVGGKFTVDENGIPIKQGLSEDVSRAADGDQLRLFEDPQPTVDPVIAKQMEQQAAERFAAEQELAKRKEIDDAYRMRAEEKVRLEQEAKAARRDEILMKLQDEISTERVSKGQQRKADRLRAPRSQRGAIDAEAVKEMTQLFKEGVASARDLLKSWKGAFTENELGVAMKAVDNPKSLDTIAFMTPEQFHELATKRTPAELNAEYTPRLRESIREGLKSKNGLWEMPYLRIDNEGKVTAHEGRHRMDVFKEQGYELIPVRLRKEAGEGWGTWKAPETIIPQEYKNSPKAVQAIAAQPFPRVLHEPDLSPRLRGLQSQRGALNFEDIVKSFPSFGKSLIKKALYHGTSSDIPFNNFKKNSRGIFLTEDPRVASDFARDNDSKTLKYENGRFVNKNTSDRVHQVYANIQNPYHLTPEEVRVFQRTENYAKMQREFKNKAEQLGHDGIIYPDGSIVAFSPDQIVSAISPINTLKGPKSQRGGLDIKAIGEGAKELVNKIVKPRPQMKPPVIKDPKMSALKDAGFKSMIPKDPTASEILESSLGAGDSNLTMTGVQSGATLTGIKYNSPLIQGIGRLYQNAQKRSEKAIRDFVYPVEYSFKKLNKEEIIELSQLMKKEMLEQREFGAEQLRAAGYTEKQITAYTQMRDLFNRVYEAQAKALESQGRKVPTKREAYLSSRWSGDWHVPVYTKDGKLVYYIAEQTKSGANAALRYLEGQFDIDKSKSKVEYRAGFSKRGSAYDAYTTMLGMLDKNDPRAATIKSVMEDYLIDQGFNALGQKKHFESKAGIGGYLGDRPWKNEKTNAYDLFKSQFDYAKHAFTWAELQKATKTSKEVLSNEYLVQEQPNNLHYAQEYAKSKLGFGDANWVNDMENAANKMLGTSKQSFYNVVGNMKSFFIIQKLGLNAGFIGANMIQPVFTLPWHGNLVSHGIKHNPFNTFIKGSLDSFSGYAKYMFDVDWPMTEVGKAALQYAEDNGIVRRSMFDETANIGRHPGLEMAEKVGSTSIQTIEHAARLRAFMGFVHHLEQSKMFDNPMDVFQRAEELTNAAMVDYRQGEGPMMFDKAGLTGEALKTLQTFKFNYYNQLHYFLKEAQEGRPNALLTFVGLQAALGGALGMPFMQEIDDVFSFLKENAPTSVHQYIKDFTPKQFLIETLPDWASYGGASKLTGAQLSSRFDSGNLADLSFDGLFPFVSDLYNQASKVGKAALDSSNSTKMAEAMYAVAPPGPIQGILETEKQEFKGPRTPEGNQVYLNPRELGKQDATFVRTPEQEAYRVLGLTELNEAKYKDLRFRQNRNEREATERRNKLAEDYFDAIVRQDKKDVEKYMYRYVKYGGDPQTLIDRLDDDMIRRRLPQETIEAMKSQSLSAVQKAKRMKEVLNGFNK